MQSMNNTQISFPSARTCIHHEFVYQVMKHPQKLAVELDDQSLTYCELLYYVQILSLTLLNEYHVVPGEIVCQCVERSLSMVIGIMGIEMTGGVYCPLSPRDPRQRLQALIQQIQSRLVLVHNLTKTKFDDDIVALDTDLVLMSHVTECVIDLNRLSEVATVSDDVAYIIFTSGSTGKPKAVQVQHKNFTRFMCSLIYGDVLNEKDTILQMARCSFDVHVHDILGSFITGGSLIMLHPRGIMDFDYLANVMIEKNITCFASVPTIINNFFTFLQQQNHHNVAQYLRSVCSGGEPCSLKLINLISNTVMYTCRLWNMYGPAETTIDCTFHLFNNSMETDNIPIGRPLSNYQNLVLDEFSQNVFIDQEGELFVGGVGVFAGYLGCDDLTAKALVKIDGQLFYRTGDLVTMDINGLLHYQGRKDHQIKLHGQRIELGEIERCLLNITSISACVVMKWNDDYLVAYVQSSDMNEEELRGYCQSHLPLHMIPSFFIILVKLPLNANGKVDRKSLPIQKALRHSPDTIDCKNVEPSNELEIYIHSLWCHILCHTRISINTNFFNIGGHSLLLIQLYHNYKITLRIDTTKIGISELFQHTTIADHARLIHQSIDDPETYQKLLFVVHNLQDACLRKRAYSTSRENMILVADELSRYEPFPVTEIQLAYLIGREGVTGLGHVSAFGYSEYDFSSTFDIECFERALNCLVQRHEALRLIFPSHTEQKILKTVPYYTISIHSLDDVQSSQKHLIERRKQLSHQIRSADQWPLFDFQVTRFISDGSNNIRLHFGFDALILDFWSTNLILHELNQLYCNLNHNLVELKLSYRDYILTEQQWKHTTIYSNDRQYWINRLKSFPLGPNLPLQCLPNEIHRQRHCNAATVLYQTLWQKLRKRIADHGLTPAGFLASVYALVLGKWSENKHFALNLPVFNRLPIHSQVNQIVGDFTSVIPLEINLDKIITYYEFLHTVQKQLWNDLEHISYDGVSFIRDLMQIHQTREILLPYVFTCGVDVEDIREKNVEHNIFFDQAPVYEISQTPQVFIDHGLVEIDGCLSINWVYVENLFRKEMVSHMHNTFVHLLVKLASFDYIWQEPIFVPLPSEQQERRLDFNQTQWESNVKDKLLHSLVIKQAELTPNALAIISSQLNLTYRQLMDRVYSLAYHLQQQQTDSNQLISILMKKGWEQVVACLAVLVSGGAYLPLDIDSPHDRLCSLIHETNVTILLTQSHYKHTFPHLTTISVDTFTTSDNYPTSFPIKQQSSTDLAYIIYTSGSTGKPKGVMISHQAVLNTILDMNSRLEISTNDRIFAVSHLNFDLSVYDIFGTLIAGGTIVIPNHEDYKNPEHWYDMIIKHHVTIWNSVPMLMQMFVEHLKHTNNNHNQLRHILLSGDWIPLSLPESIQTTLGEQITITSLGGATEASIWSIAYTLPEEIPREWKSIPYGIPLRNQEYYIYDIHLHDCPEWVIGELYIGGEGLANGYWNDQEKTQSSFIIHPSTNKRLYRTGDYGRFLPNGYIEFLGRKDFQVKVHGHRIELGEIEYQLQQHLDIHQAIVNIDDKSQYLVGYVMPEKHSIHDEENDSAEMLITDPIERINFKLARHGIRHQKKVEKSFALTKPKLTETLINIYYMRKNYRQFTNEIIERSTIEKLLKNSHNSNDNGKISFSHLDFDILSQLLAVLTPISVADQPLPKHYYASIGDLHPVQVYVELPTSLDNILPGVYYHNPDKHTLELISSHINNDMKNIRLHLVGRSSAIAPLYGKRSGYQFCMLETGYVMGLLEKEGSILGLTFSKNTHNELITRDILNIDENDTYYCSNISSFEQHISSNVQNDNYQCIIYFKSVNNNKDQWFIYNKENDTVTPFDVETETKQEEIPLFFEDDDDAKIIFHDCQCAVFFVGRSECTMNIGKMSHLLMDHCLEMNIGMCPIGTRSSFPKQINDVLDTIITHEKLNRSNILHTLLIGKISSKQKRERTISKVKSMPSWSETLRIYLKKKLPMYMVPAHFMSVSSFPLSPNGKIDRKALPEISLSVLQQEDTYTTPNTELEKMIASIWQEILYADRLIIQHDDPTKIVSGISRQTYFLISTTTSFFSVGGNSLLLVKIYQQYQSKFNFETEAMSIRPFFEYNTIVEHAKLLETIIIDGAQLRQWHTLHINVGIASYAQERIFLDEKMRFSGENAIYNELAVLQVKKGSLSMNRLLQALRCVLSKHKILRTSLVFNEEDSTLKQSITNKHLTFTLAADQTFKSETDLHNIISQISTNPNLFDLSGGRVFYCQILKQQMTPDENYNKEIITNSDVLVIGFHHAAVDQSAGSIFLNDLYNTYNSNMAGLDNEESLQYIDYAVHERLIDMTLSREFWRLQLEGCNLKRQLSLPIDQHCLSNNGRSGFASTMQITFDRKISSSFLNYASLHHLTLFQLGLATFYTFLFKLTYSQTDLCISCVNANRYRTELQNMIGMFVSTLPYCVQLDPQWSFDEVVKYVREKCLSILEHSHYPLQHILRDFHLNQSTVPFLQTVFDFITVSSVNDQFIFDDVSLQPVSLEQFSGAAKFDFSLEFVYNPILDDNILSCRFICSRDLFEDTTVTKMIQRLQYLFEQLFSTNFNVNQTELVVSPIANLTLILPDEMNEIQHVAFYRKSNVTNEAPASFAQARIWLDERIRFDPDKPQVAIYNMPFVYRLQPGHTLSIKQLRHALHLTVNKHLSLHTSLYFDTQKNLLMQRVTTNEDKNNNIFSIIETTYETDEQVNEILHDEKRNPHLFDLAQGLVFRCHIIYYKSISSNHLLSDKDLLIFNFHHALFDFPSMQVFHHDLNEAYTTGQLLHDGNTNLRYLDYAVIEQQMSMTGASMLWFDALHDCKLDQPLSLPFDRYRLSNEHRTGRGTSISFDFGQDLSHHFLLHASSNSISLEQLALATYYVFLFKLTNGEKDLCIGINTHGRYRDELEPIIGMFVNAIPIRCQLDPHLSFHTLTKHVRDIMINYIKYSYFPLQRILNQHPKISNPVFLDTSFEFISSMTKDEENKIMIGDSRFSLLPYSIKISEDEVMSKFDFILRFQHDLNLNEFSCTIDASLDLFNTETICIIAQRLQTMLYQQFTSFNSQINKPVHELSLALSNEQYLMQSLNNTQISFPSPLTCIHHEFVYQVMKHPQKLAVELDDQSLTYCELLYYVQILSLTLLNKYHVISGEIVCQCVERSLSMVIGIMGIEMAGGVYCPLSPQDPQHRLHALTQQTQSRLVLVQHSTTLKFSDEIVSCNIDLIWTVGHANTAIILDSLSDVLVIVENIAYIVFTSGSTGISKAVQIRHRNLLSCIDSLVRLHLFTNKDTMIQMASCSYDVHVQEIIGALIIGSTIIMLRPQGNMSLEYMTKTLNGKQVSYISFVPSYANILLEFLESHSISSLSSLRTVAVGGEASTVQLIDKLYVYLPQDGFVWNGYGPSETTVDSTTYVIRRNINMINIPIGRPLLNYRCMIMNEYLQSSVGDQEGELVIGGVGVFTGYLGRDDLTAKALTEIDGELYYRTGDLVTMDINGLLYYQGRKDHQIKLHGQRIELGEIERCLLNITSISACVVIKWKDDYLAAYVQSSHNNEEELRQHCQSHLPPHMIPSFFIILEKLPLNQNGKIDRKQLPSPDFSLSTLLLSDKSDTPLNQFEEHIHTIWCQVLHRNENHISRTTSFFSVGGHSLRFIELYYRYQSLFNFDAHSLSIGLFLQQPTIRQHAQLLQTLLSNDTQTAHWQSQHINPVLANVTLTDQNILEVGCGRGAGAAWCVRTYASRSYVGIDPSQDVINLCEKCYSIIPRLSFMIADPETHLPLQNESMNVVLSIETTNLFDEIEVVKKFVGEITRVLTPNGYLLWCGLCNVDGSSVLIDYLTENHAFIIDEKVNITRNVLHALDIQNKSHADFIERYIQPADQEYCRLFAGLPGTPLYDNMQQGRAEYRRVVFRKKIAKRHFIFKTKF
ncbi:unnamed protein product [Adineta steineri]|uniref:Carrier domain-containing protein n=1 Tax=Adineta steineri TaxID=433720 RepID=A0A813R8F5_9BILA|nr:unnamed protein product [Adineta steineri]